MKKKRSFYRLVSLFCRLIIRQVSEDARRDDKYRREFPELHAQARLGLFES